MEGMRRVNGVIFISFGGQLKRERGEGGWRGKECLDEIITTREL